MYERVEQLHETIFPDYGVVVDSSYLVSGYESYIDDAQKLYDSYASELQAILDSFGIDTEVCIINII